MLKKTHTHTQQQQQQKTKEENVFKVNTIKTPERRYWLLLLTWNIFHNFF